MFAKKYWLVALALIVALASLGAAAPAGAEDGAAVALSVGQESFSAGESVLVQVSISNPSGKAVKVLKWYTPADEVEEPVFEVSLDGQPVQYLGAIYKRPAPSGADYLALKPGESITYTVDLAAYYDLSASGDYTVRYAAASPDLFSEKPGALKKVASLTSNEVKVYVEGRVSGPAPEAVVPLAVTGTTSFSKCTATQQSTLISARSQASAYSADALAYLTANKTGARYTTWFGVVTSARYNTATSHFSAISDAMDTKPVTLDCGCKKRYYAYVYPNQPYKIYVCSTFWKAPMTGTDSKAGTLIHEMSHFNVVAATDDYVYGQTGAKSLAISNPNQAVDNADNHEYFAENTPAQQ
jgi:peptidyl-Lys metalloendopeptidase